jgi:hypothetical protein
VIKKKRFGSVSFEYIEKYDTEENAIKGERGSFVEVKLGPIKIEKTLITKEDSNGSKNSFAKAERLAAKET